MPGNDLDNALDNALLVDSTLTFLAKKIKEQDPPVDMWTPKLYPECIQGLSERVNLGEIQPLWVEESQPEQGLVLYAPSPWESNLFGFGCARCLGPFLAVGDQKEREKRAKKLADQTAWMAKKMRHRLVTAKIFHDPAVLRGFLAANFTLAEIGVSLSGTIAEMGISEVGSTLVCPSDFAFLEPGQAAEVASEVVKSLENFFYDGHFLHHPFPGPEASLKLWSQVLLDDLNGQADPVILLWDLGQDRVAGVATVRSNGRVALLNIMTVANPYRKKGLGRLIMQETLHRLAGRSTELQVETASYNLAALKLYQNSGLNHIAPLVALHLQVDE